METQYIGHKKVVGKVIVDGLLTPSGKPVYEVLYDGEPKELVSSTAFDAVVTPTVSDLTAARDRKVKLARQLILDVMTEYDITKNDEEYLFSAAAEDFTDNIQRAENFAFFGDDSLFIPGYNPVKEATPLRILRLLKSIPRKDETPTKTDGGTT